MTRFKLGMRVRTTHVIPVASLTGTVGHVLTGTEGTIMEVAGTKRDPRYQVQAFAEGREKGKLVTFRVNIWQGAEELERV